MFEVFKTLLLESQDLCSRQWIIQTPPPIKGMDDLQISIYLVIYIYIHMDIIDTADMNLHICTIWFLNSREIKTRLILIFLNSFLTWLKFLKKDTWHHLFLKVGKQPLFCKTLWKNKLWFPFWKTLTGTLSSKNYLMNY